MKLQNDFITIEVSEDNAEIISLKKKENNFEIMFDRNPKHWSNCNPVLFPWISSGWGPEYQYDGKMYKMGNHGFARKSKFKVVKENESEIELELVDNEELYNNQYPFHFRLVVNYSLENKKVWLKYKVYNTDNKPIPFMLGYHPAFRVPMSSTSKYEDYYIQFEKEEDLTKGAGHNETLGHHLCDYGVTSKLCDPNIIPFNGNGSVFFKNLKSEHVDMTDGKDGIRVGIKNFRDLGFWKKTKEFPFICIEPQNGHGYANDNNDDITMNNIISLPIGQNYESSYYWEVL